MSARKTLCIEFFQDMGVKKNAKFNIKVGIHMQMVNKNAHEGDQFDDKATWSTAT